MAGPGHGVACLIIPAIDRALCQSGQDSHCKHCRHCRIMRDELLAGRHGRGEVVTSRHVTEFFSEFTPCLPMPCD
jgi:hypothetical protein